MLNSRDPYLPIHQGGGQPRIAHVLGAGSNFDRMRKVHAAKNYTGVWGGGTQGQKDLVACVQPDTSGPDHVSERSLPDHGCLSPGTSESVSEDPDIRLIALPSAEGAYGPLAPTVPLSAASRHPRRENPSTTN
jgi:hypothetical protein